MFRRIAAIAVCAFLALSASGVGAEPRGTDWGFREYHAAEDEGIQGHWLVFSVTLPKGTSVNARSEINTKVWDYLDLVRSVLLVGDAPEDLATSLDFPIVPDDRRQLAYDLRRFRGGELFTQLAEEFEAVVEQGYLSFPVDVEVRVRQFMPLTPADANQLALRGFEDTTADRVMMESAPREVDGERESSADSPSFAARSATQQNSTAGLLSYVLQRPTVDPDQLLRMNAQNLLASLLAYHNEYGELPADFETLVATDLVLLPMQNPVTNGRAVGEDTRVPGRLYYGRTSINVGVIVLPFASGELERITLERPEPAPGSTGQGVLGLTKTDFSVKEQEARRYVFQIAMLLRAFYDHSGYLPSTVAHMELQRFARLGFRNPFAPDRTASMVPSLGTPSPGDYFYFRASPSEFILVGFGEKGERLITIRMPIPQK